MKKFLLFLSILFLTIFGYGQSNPDEEILVFFNSGVLQVENTLNGEKVKTAKITKDKLIKSLNEIGITHALMEVAIPMFNKADTLKVMENGQRIKQPDMTNLFKIKVPEGKKRQEMIEYLNSLPEVLYAEPNGRAVPLAVPSDLRFTEQWGLKNNTNPGADIHAEAAWDIYKGNLNNIIAVIDGGVETNHVDLDNKISGGDTGFGWDGHGTHVAGIAAAESNNSQGVSGVDWNARIHPKRIDNISSDADTYQAIVDAVNFSPNVHVINHSWGLEYANEDPGRYSITVRQAFAYAYKANRTSVVAMGNHQQTHPNVVNYPAGFGNVIAVGATNNNDIIAGFSAQGNHIDVSAPGVGILSTLNGDYATNSGTSMAAPFVSGIASLLKGYDPDLANDDIENIIKLSSDDKGLADFDNAYGFGRVNAEEALKFLEAPYSLSQLTATSGSAVSSTGQSQVVFMGAGSLASSTYIAKRYEVRKNVVFPDDYLNIEGVWGRGVFTTGWNISNPNYGEGFCEVVPGTLTDNGATLRTYVYEVWSITGSYLGYYPTTPSNVEFAYTVLGVKAPFIIGPEVLCNNTTYTLNELPAGVSVSWSTSSNLQIVSNNGSSISVKPIGNGEGFIEAVFPTATARKNVWVSIPNEVTRLSHVSFGCTMGEIFAKPALGAEQYEWQVTGAVITDNGGTSYINGSSIFVDPHDNLNSFTVKVRGINSCGTSEWYTKTIPMDCSGGPTPLSTAPEVDNDASENIVAYPNPAKDQITVIVREDFEYSKSRPTEIHAIRVLDQNSIERQYHTFKQNKTVQTIDISYLTPGLNFLLIYTDTGVITKKILVR